MKTNQPKSDTPNWSAVDTLRAEIRLRTPPGAFSRRDYEARYGVKKEAALQQLRALVAAGKLAVAKFPMPTGGTQNMWWVEKKA
jgi:hypothetical protein